MNWLRKNKKIALFMIYLAVSLIFIMPYVIGQESVGSSKATGDLAVNIPIVHVPGKGNLDYDVLLSYVGGDGIKPGTPSSWVGLGWDLSAGSISRQVVGFPDDLNVKASGDLANTHYFKYYKEDIDTRTWWEKYGPTIFMIVLMVVRVVLAAVTGGTSEATFMGFLFTLAQNLAMQIGTQILSALVFGTSLKISIGFTDLVLASLSSFTDVFGGPLGEYNEDIFGSFTGTFNPDGTLTALGELVNIAEGVEIALALKGGIEGINKLSGYIDSLNIDEGEYENINKAYTTKGFFYSFNEYQNVFDKTIVQNDIGQPDKYSVSGPWSSEIFPASKYVSKENSGGYWESFYIPVGTFEDSPEDVFQFYPKVLEGIETYTIDFRTGISGACNDFTPSEGIGNLDRSTICNKYETYIDMFIVTGPDGTKLIYGSPNVPGSIIRMHKQYNVFMFHGYADGSEKYLRQESASLTHHPIEWKLVAILGSDYDTDHQPLYPLSSPNIEDLDGSWVAFKYDVVANYLNPANQCAFVGGDPTGLPIMDPLAFQRDGDNGFDRKDSYDWSINSVDVSYLSEIQTPYYVAKFNVEDSHSLNDKEAPKWKQTHNYYLGWDRMYATDTFFWNAQTNIFKDDRDCESEDNTMKKILKSVDLYRRQSPNGDIGLKTKTVTFDGDYILKNTFNYNEYDYGLTPHQYTLKSVTSCFFDSRNELCSKPYSFNYNKFN